MMDLPSPRSGTVIPKTECPGIPIILDQIPSRDVDMALAQRIGARAGLDLLELPRRRAEVRSSRKLLRIWPVGRRNSILPVASNPSTSLAASFMTYARISACRALLRRPVPVLRS
jgi:hypothetical protein